MSNKEKLARFLMKDLQKALLLMQEYRSEVLRQNIHPVASRIALKFAVLCDTHYAEAKITPETEILIEEIASDLFEKVR